jgi:2-polyprenyl-3-methyl-5-hydroxy-6-metoxy-1,4-benzoquinol methylase
MLEDRNSESQDFWGVDSVPDISSFFLACLGYSKCPGWAFIRRAIETFFGSFKGLKTIELGSGEGKVSLLFSLLGANTTLVDLSPNQLTRARYAADKFKVQPTFVKEDLLRLPKHFYGQYDVSMSFGTAEHFFGRDRQRVFFIHSAALRKGGLSILWVPNRNGLLFHLGVMARKLFKRHICQFDEAPFTKNELLQHARQSGLTDIKIVGGELLINDFNNHVLNVRRLLRFPGSKKAFTNARQARNELLQCIAQNNARIKPWNNLFSYPLILIGRKSG